jgi:hypothetical protein
VRRWLAAGVTALSATALVGCGGGTHSGPLALVSPRVLIPHRLPHDRVLVARVRNTSSGTLHLVAARIVVRDRSGRRLQASAGFTTTYAHGLFGAFQQPNPVPRAELIRLGRLIDLVPGATAPFYAAWRLLPGSKEPVDIDYGQGRMRAPERAQLTGP